MINTQILKDEQKSWNDILNSKDTKSLWSKINWNGSTVQTKPTNPPDISEFSSHYKSHFNHNSQLSTDLIINSSIYIPILDDAFSYMELSNAVIAIKKDNADYDKNISKILLNNFPFMLLLILNKIFFTFYPTSLNYLYATAIPKKGDLSKVTNYCLIQSMRRITNI